MIKKLKQLFYVEKIEINVRIDQFTITIQNRSKQDITLTHSGSGYIHGIYSLTSGGGGTLDAGKSMSISKGN